MDVDERARELFARKRTRMGFYAWHLALVARGLKTETRRPYGASPQSRTQYEVGMILWLTTPHWFHPGKRRVKMPPHIWDEQTKILRFEDGRATTPFDLVVRMPWRSRQRRYMPYWGCVVMAELLSFERQRLHDMTPAQAIAEGVEHCNVHATPGTVADINVARYAALWNMLHGRGCWDLNPEICRFTFRLVEPEVSHRMRELSVLAAKKKEKGHDPHPHPLPAV